LPDSLDVRASGMLSFVLSTFIGFNESSDHKSLPVSLDVRFSIITVALFFAARSRE
jgi:hypothetical protein